MIWGIVEFNALALVPGVTSVPGWATAMKITSLEAVDCAATRWPSLARLNREVIALSSGG
jgi:hypothetical protein